MKRNTKEKTIFVMWSLLSFVMWLLFFIMFIGTYEEQVTMHTKSRTSRSNVLNK